MLIVKKFGGSSLATNELIANAARIIVDTHKQGHQVICTLSARGDETDELMALADSVNPKASMRERDMLLATGEQVSIALVAMAIEQLGAPVVSLTAQQAGIASTRSHSNARVKNINKTRIESELERGKIVLVAGFQGINRFEDITTLGRGSGDVTAVALAAAFNAEQCRKYTDSDGIYTADPRIVENARKLAEIGYEEMIEMAALGANVLAVRAVSLAKKHGVRIVVLSSTLDTPGTTVKEGCKMEGLKVSGVTVDKKIARISLDGITNAPGVWFKIFSVLNRRSVGADMVSQSISRDGIKDISFTVNAAEQNAALDVLNENKSRIGFEALRHEGAIAKLSVISAGAATNPDIPSKMFEALFDSGINIQMISTSEVRTSVLVSLDDADRAAKAVHQRFIDEGYM